MYLIQMSLLYFFNVVYSQKCKCDDDQKCVQWQKNSNCEDDRLENSNSIDRTQYIQLVQNVLLKANINIEKYVQLYSKNLKSCLKNSTTRIDSSIVNKILDDFKIYKTKINKAIETFNRDIARKADAKCGIY